VSKNLKNAGSQNKKRGARKMHVANNQPDPPSMATIKKWRWHITPKSTYSQGKILGPIPALLPWRHRLIVKFCFFTPSPAKNSAMSKKPPS